MTRRLPSRVNPRLVEDIPPYKDLVDLRRLGQTNLGTGKTSDAGLFAYVHLRAPLPPIQHSELFGASTPESYFLMRRSYDGYVSCTGMFKASFPWATKKEEDEERRYVKENFPRTSKDETAGNLWVHPADALTLAEEYGMTIWIEALLDNHPVSPSSGKKQIEAPPPFYRDGVEPPPHKELVERPPSVNEFLAPPSLSATSTSTRRRATRSSSPSKRHMSPRKSRLTKSSVAVKEIKDIPIRADPLTLNLNGTKEREKSETPATTTTEAETEPVAKTTESKEEEATEAKEITTTEVKEKTTTEVKKKTTIDAKEKPTAEAKEEKKTEVKKEVTVTTVETKETTSEEAEVKKEPVVKVEVDNVSKTNGEVKVEKTHVKVEYSADEEVKFLPIPVKEDMMTKAREMVEESRKLDGELQGRKRPNKEIAESQDEEEEASADDSEIQPQLKKSRILEEQLKKEKIKTKSLIALSVGLTLTALIPHFL